MISYLKPYNPPPASHSGVRLETLNLTFSMMMRLLNMSEITCILRPGKSSGIKMDLKNTLPWELISGVANKPVSLSMVFWFSFMAF